MISEQHALIQAFLQQKAFPLSSQPVEPRLNKAGLVPYRIEDGHYTYYVMKPQGKEVEKLGEPPFQFGKGTRMFYTEAKGWQDIRSKETSDMLEPLVQTALREGIEELGLILQHIDQIVDLGPYGFSSATTGKPKYMYLFAAHMKDDAQFLPAQEVAVSTAERRWMSLQEFAIAGRSDHKPILESIEQKLKTHHETHRA
ncbi:MAG: NUDIX hydrolase [Rickettsiales bacterium]|nr:NUDIX hydrolase [Rickettsiales bacterium]